MRIALSGGGRITHNAERSLDASMDGQVTEILSIWSSLSILSILSF